MKLKSGFVLRSVMGKTVVVATGEASKTFHGMIKLNRTAEEIWRGLQEEMTENQISRKISEKYGISEAQAASDVKELLKRMQEKGFLTE